MVCARSVHVYKMAYNTFTKIRRQKNSLKEERKSLKMLNKKSFFIEKKSSKIIFPL